MPSGVLNRAPPDAASGWWSYDAKERRINELERENAGLKAKVGSPEAMNTALKAKQVALGAEVSALRWRLKAPRNTAYQQTPVHATYKQEFPFLELAKGAWAVAAKVSADSQEFDHLSGIIIRGEARVGAGRTLTLLKGKYARGHRVPGACPIVSINHLGVHLAAHVAWKEGFLTYAATSTAGCIILCGDAEGFSEWAKSEACKAEVKDMPDGRLFALIDGYIVCIDMKSGTASATVANGTGSVVWASGAFYKGDIKHCKMHGEGSWTGANGDTYSGQYQAGKPHGKGIYLYANGDKYYGHYKDGRKHGTGTMHLANAVPDGRGAIITMQKGCWSHGRFMGADYEGPAPQGPVTGFSMRPKNL